MFRKLRPYVTRSHLITTISGFFPVAFALAQSACATAPTPPETTSVYEDDVGQGIEPLPVERQSVDRPDISPVPIAGSEASAPEGKSGAKERERASETQDDAREHAQGKEDAQAKPPGGTPPEPEESEGAQDR